MITTIEKRMSDFQGLQYLLLVANDNTIINTRVEARLSQTGYPYYPCHILLICLDQESLIRFIKYPGLTCILHGINTIN